MSNDATNFAGNIPEHYDRDLGPVSFADLARRLAARRPLRALEAAAGTGIVTRHSRDQARAYWRRTSTRQFSK